MTHIWITGARERDRRLAASETAGPATVSTVDAHRRHRGPYTAVGTVLRALMPAMLRDTPDLVAAHDVEILCAAPELRDLVPATRETLTSLAIPEERTRFYSRLRTLRISHGLVELLRDHLRPHAGTAMSLVIHQAHAADQTDREFLSVALRRLDPALLRLVICTADEVADEQLVAALTTYATRHRAEAAYAGSPVGDPAAAYIESDGTTDEQEHIAAYEALTPEERARRHDARADMLTARGEFSLLLGAVPYHRELGADPSGAGAAALETALNYCVNMGFYEATVDFAVRGRALVDWFRQVNSWWVFTTKMTTSLAILGRPDEAEALYDEARAHTAEPLIHRQAAYATAMLYTRHRDPDRRDHQKARGWINEAIAFARLLGKTDGNSFAEVFQLNGLALIEVHLGRPENALALVNEGIARLDRDLGPDRHLLHRSVLRHNRSQVLASLGRLDAAIEDLTAVIDADPNYAEYHFDRANLLHRVGRDDEALAEYDAAIRLSPPFPEVYYNRADVRFGRGDLTGALADFDYVIELDPTFLDAYVNRAGIWLAQGRFDDARGDVVTGLSLDPDNAHLHCLLGELHAEVGEYLEAESVYRRATALDPDLVAAWAGLAGLAHARGDHAGAIANLDCALAVEDAAALRYNRALAYLALGIDDLAVADLDRAVELDPLDPEIRAEWDRRRGEIRSGA